MLDVGGRIIDDMVWVVVAIGPCDTVKPVEDMFTLELLAVHIACSVDPRCMPARCVGELG